MRSPMSRVLRGGLTLCAAAGILTPARAQGPLPPALRSGIDSTVEAVLARTGAPGASVALVQDGRVAYARAYGSARLDPRTPATPDMRYSIGSISQQFTAAAILLLAERGQLSLDDRLNRWVPLLTRAGNVSVRQLLSMTSGYQDYWPQDYVMPGMLQPTTAREIVTTWAGKPLDFEPGTRWQYSNTNYVIAGMIVEQVSGMALVDFLRKEIFLPLHMQSVAIVDEGPLGPGDPQGYLRYALGPPRPAPKEGKGWLFAAGGLAMTAFDLAQWDVSVIDQTVLKPASYREQQATTLLADGTATGYGLGVNVGVVDGHRVISHGGEVSGFTAQNRVYPDDRAAVVVLVNLDASPAAGQIAAGISRLLFAVTDSQAPQAAARVRAIFQDLQRGRIDRTQLSGNANFYFSDRALADFASSLGPLGQVVEVTELGHSLRGGMVYRGFRVRCAQGTVTVSTFTLPDGRLEQFQVAGG